uniref:Uncharacterized protein n=1 Tax=Thermogemmatispora argillosa TaxID=2045280 RepID=A0A455T3Z1_9CHLR|nr:hypothetical protein KTA_14040 [Thermogemmatispora argillosa]
MIWHWPARLHSVAPALASLTQIPFQQIQATLAALPAEWVQDSTHCGGLAVWGYKL